MSEKEKKKQQNRQHYFKKAIVEKCKKFHERVGEVKISLKFLTGQNKDSKFNFEPREIQERKSLTGIDQLILCIKSLGSKFVDANPTVKE